MDNMNDVAKYVYEMGYLKHLQRAGWAMISVSAPETVAGHSFRAAILGFILATLEGADPLKTATICLFHDTAETRIGDLHRLARRYINVGESEAIALVEQVERLPQETSNIVRSLVAEYEDKNTLEGKIAKDADALECLIQAREYLSQGYAAAEEWVTGSYTSLRTESAKRLADACMQVEPHEWWQGLKVNR